MKKTIKKTISLTLIALLLIPTSLIIASAAPTNTFLWPVPSSYSMSRGFSSSGHKAIDVNKCEGKDIVASYDGVVYSYVNKCQHYSKSCTSCDSTGMGVGLILKHTINGTTYYTYYAHMQYNSVPSAYRSKNATVKQGDVIGKVGSSGNSTGPHLHFTITKGTAWSNYINNNPTDTSKHTITSSSGISYKYSTSYTLSYNANGGSGAPGSQNKPTSSPNWYAISDIKPTREGYTFLGWAESNSATSAEYVNGEFITLEKDQTLYAVWRKNTLKVYFNANGGSISSDTYNLCSNIVCNKSDSSQYYQKWTYNSTKTNGLINHSTFGIYRNGYSFVGWGTKANGGTIFDQGDNSLLPTDINSNIKNGNCSVTLYAIWEKNPVTSYTLSYNANGGSNPPANQTGATSYTISSAKPTKSGYTFLGWSKSSSATSASYSAGDTITISSNTTLYAVWSKNTFTLSYNANGGSNPPSSQSDSTSYTISSTRPTRSGYTFLGWSKSSSATSASYTAGDTITISSNTTLYAVWSKNTFTLSYNANGGSNPPSSQSDSTSYTISSTRPTRSGYTFLGWSKSSSATSASYTAGDTITISSNTTLYAVWSKNTFTLSYNANGGSGAPSSQSGSTSYTISSTIPTRSGYTFLGWSKSSSAVSPSYYAGNTISISSYTVLYAVWQKTVEPTVKIHNNPGTATIDYGDSLKLTAVVTDKPADAKIYWYADGELAGEGETVIVDSAATVTVKLVNRYGTVLKDSNGNEISDSQTVKVNSGFFQIIISFFKNLFGANRTTVQIFKNNL